MQASNSHKAQVHILCSFRITEASGRLPDILQLSSMDWLVRYCYLLSFQPGVHGRQELRIGGGPSAHEKIRFRRVLAAGDFSDLDESRRGFAQAIHDGDAETGFGDLLGHDAGQAGLVELAQAGEEMGRRLEHLAGGAEDGDPGESCGG